jgi:hypothetical protein
MRRFEVRTPEGQTVIVEANTPEEAVAKVGGGGLKDSFLGGVVRGMRDPIDAGAQLLVRGANALGLAPDSEVQRVEGINKAAEQDYAQNWRGGRDLGLDAGRVTGSILATLPIAGGGAARGAAEIAKAGAKAGAVGGALQPVQEAEDGFDFAKQKLFQTGLGAVTGAAAGPAIDVGFRGLSGVSQKLVEKSRVLRAGPWNGGEPAEVASLRILGNIFGPDWQALSKELQDQLRYEVTQSLKKTGRVDPAAVQRRAAFSQAGIEPTKAWITRNPVDWTHLENMRGIGGAGEKIQERVAQASARMGGMLDELEPRVPVGSTPYERGEVAAKQVESAYRGIKESENSLWDKVASFADSGVRGDGVRLADDVARRSSPPENVLAIPQEWAQTFKSIAEGKIPSSPEVIVNLRKAANELHTSSPAAARVIKQALDAELECMAQSGGGEGVAARAVLEAQRMATGASKARFQLEESVPAFGDAAKGAVERERFFAKYVQSANVDEVRRLLAQGDPLVLSAIRGDIVAAMKNAAFGSKTDAGAPFAAERFANFLRQPGMPEKLKMVLGTADYRKVMLLKQVSEAAKIAPEGEAINRSRTSQGVINFALRVLSSVGNDTPGAVLKGTASVLNAPRMGGAMSPSPTDLAARAPGVTIDQSRADALKRLLAPAAGSYASGEASR